MDINLEKRGCNHLSSLKEELGLLVRSIFDLKIFLEYSVPISFTVGICITSLFLFIYFDQILAIQLMLY